MWSCHTPISWEAENMRGTFLKYIWANNVRNELDWRSRRHTTVEFSNTVAAERWIPTRTQCAHLRVVQGRMLRKMICAPRLLDEVQKKHMTRLARLLLNCRAKHKFPPGDETYFASNFSCCRHMARITTRDPKRETRTLLLQNMS